MTTAKLQEDKLWAEYWLSLDLSRTPETPIKLIGADPKTIANELSVIAELKRKRIKTNPHEL